MKYDAADMITLRQSLHNSKSIHRQRRIDAEMGMRYLVKKFGKETVEEMKADIARKLKGEA